MGVVIYALILIVLLSLYAWFKIGNSLNRSEDDGMIFVCRFYKKWGKVPSDADVERITEGWKQSHIDRFKKGVETSKMIIKETEDLVNKSI